MLNILKLCKNKLDILLGSYIFKNPERLYEVKMQKVDTLVEKLIMLSKNILENKTYKYNYLLDKLETLSPIKTLKRGYSITKIDNKIIETVKNIKPGMHINTTLEDGEIISEIMEVKNGK